MGDSSHTEGNLTKASGDYSHAEGNATEALGIGAHSEGGRETPVAINIAISGHNNNIIWSTSNLNNAKKYIGCYCTLITSKEEKILTKLVSVSISENSI
jgi:hypothetical protein